MNLKRVGLFSDLSSYFFFLAFAFFLAMLTTPSTNSKLLTIELKAITNRHYSPSY